MPANPFHPIQVDAPELVRALDRAATRYPLARKVVVASAHGAGRELLRTLARLRGGWTGFVVETPRPFALQLASLRLAEAGLRVLDEFEEEALIDQAVDATLGGGGPARAYAHLAGGPGFRRTVRSAVTALRLAGIPPDGLARSHFGDAAKRDLLRGCLAFVEEAMRSRGVVDVAGLLGIATEGLTAGDPISADHVFLLPGLSARGASGRFIQALRDRGAEILPTDPVSGFDVPRGMVWPADGPGAPRNTAGLPLFDDAPAPPVDSGPPPLADVEIFHAAGIHEELREVLRRVLASGRRFDDVEIVTPDPATYGPALHAMATRLDIGVTFAVGLPVARTRPGRALAAYLRWIGDDFPSSVLRRLLETGDLAAPRPFHHLSSGSLARRLRRLRIGWGRERYEAMIGGARGRLDHRAEQPLPEETIEDAERRAEQERRELDALSALTRHLLRHAPPEVPKRLEIDPRPVSPAALARGLAAFLGLVPTVRGSVDETAKERLLRVLDRIRETLTRPVPFGAAAGVLQDHLDIRVPAPRAEGRAPWLSDGGSIHLSDIEHGGLTARPVTFLVGMDAGRFPGGDLQDPLLLDGERTRLSGDLPTSGQRLEDRQFALAALLARLRGQVTFSHAAWDAGEARVLAPSPVLLQAFRLASGNANAGFSDLRAHLGAPVSRIPRGVGALDRDDVWLDALVHGDHFLEGVDVVRASYPRLDAGLIARRAWEDGDPGPHHGLLSARPRFDPRANPETILSASRMETLGACPLRYLYRYVLRISPPDDPAYAPDVWLDPLARGGLLHRVYERLLRTARDEGIAIDDEAFSSLGRRILTAAAKRLTEEIPPPSDAVFRRELDDLASDLRCFIEHVRQHPPEWEAVERAFGLRGEPPVSIDLGGRLVQLRGAVDRIDRVGPGGEALRIVDYKTGGAGSHWSVTTGVYNGGRRLQHILYSLAVESLEGRPVEAVEYHFPTRKGEGVILPFQRSDLREGTNLLATLLDAAKQGRFLPTDRLDDCQFCDYRAMCRVQGDGWRVHSSPPAAWGRSRLAAGDPAYAELARVRAFEGDN